MDTIQYIFTEFISPVDSTIIARNAIKSFIENNPSDATKGMIESLDWKVLIAVLAIILTPIGIYLREQFVKFEEAISTLEYLSYWNITLMSRIDQMIYNLEETIPIIKRLLEDEEVPTVQIRSPYVEFDVKRIDDLKIDKIIQYYINFRNFTSEEKSKYIQLINDQFANYTILKESISISKNSLGSEKIQKSFNSLDELMLDFRHETFLIIEKNKNTLVGIGPLYDKFKTYEYKRKQNKNKRSLDIEFLNDVSKILNENYKINRGLNNYYPYLKLNQHLILKYQQFYNDFQDVLESQNSLLNYLKNVRNSIGNNQINILNVNVTSSWYRLKIARSFNSNKHIIIKLIQDRLDSGLELTRIEMEKIVKEENELKAKTEKD